MEQQFIEWYADIYLEPPKAGSAMVRLLREAFEAGYNQNKAEEQENTRLLKMAIGHIRIDP